MENESFNIREFAGLIANALGSSWTVKPLTQNQIEDGYTPIYADIVDSKTEATIGFSRVWNKKTHVHVSGSYPYRDAEGKTFWNLPYNVENPSINSAIAKGPEKVARDIEKRLLPEYLPLLNDCLAKRKAYGTSESSLHTVSDRLAKDLGASVRYEQYKADISLYHSKAFADDSVNIEVRQYPGHEKPEVRISGLEVSDTECWEIFNLLAKLRGTKL